jgi:hypothetical protein
MNDAKFRIFPVLCLILVLLHANPAAMRVPIGIIREVERSLPNVKTFNGDFIRKDFEYQKEHYSINFYKVRDLGDYFWICDPTQVRHGILRIVQNSME